MSTGSTVAAPQTEVSTPTPSTPPKNKQEIYSRIAAKQNKKVEERFSEVAKRVKERHKEEIHMRRVFGDDDGRALLVEVFNDLLLLLVSPDDAGNLVKGKTVGLPAGLGSIELLTAGATKKKTPQGAMIDVKERWRVKWNPGKTIDDLLATLPPPTPSEDASDQEVPAAPAQVAPQATEAPKAAKAK